MIYRLYLENGFEVDEETKNIILKLLEKYKNKQTYTDCEEYRKQGAISALEELLEELGLYNDED